MIAILQKSVFWRLLIPFISGIILQYHLRLQISNEFAWIISGLLLSIWGTSFVIHAYFWRGLFGATLTCLSLWSGVLLTMSILGKLSWNISGQEHHYSLVLLEDPVPKNKTLRCKACILGSSESLFDQVAGKQVIVYLLKNEKSSGLVAGSGIEIEAVLSKPEASRKEEFDYRSYLEKQGFSAVGFVKNGRWQSCRVQTSWASRIKFLALAYRRKIISQLKSIIPDEKNATIAAALFVGSKEELSPELRNAFSSTGVAHILAVSGLHLAVLFVILCFLFSPFERSVCLRSISYAIIMLLLWSFTFVTGLAPSIVRANIMICFTGMGVLLNRRSMTMNSLAASAMFMLMYNPLYLFDVGFQLSFAAVLSIALFNPYFTRLREFKSRISGYFRELACVSVSAQIGTAPLTLYYFHQFPVFFILANLFAIPLSGLLLILIPFSVLLQTVYSFPSYLFIPLNASLDLFASGIEMFSAIPFSVWTVTIDSWGVFSMYTGIGLILLLLVRKRIHYLYLFLILVVLQVFYYF